MREGTHLNILLVGQFEMRWNSERMYYRVLKDMGNHIYRFDYIENYRILSLDIHKIPKIGDIIINITNKNLFDEAKKARPDILLVIKGEGISPKTILKIKREVGAKAIFWMHDDPQLFDEISRNAAFAYDYVLTSSEQCIPMYRYMGIKNVEYMPFMCDPTIHKKVELTELEKEKYGSDVCFVGTYYYEREYFLRALKDFNLKIWGPGWDNSCVDNAIKIKVMGRAVSPEIMVKIFNASKIVLNIHHAQMKYGGMKANSRVFEATGCGSLHLTDKTVGLEDLFECGKEVICYNDKKELVESVKYYLDNPEEREEIANKGQKRAYKDHTVYKRMERVLEIAYKITKMAYNGKS
jgi:spore maturation protein CgeB